MELSIIDLDLMKSGKHASACGAAKALRSIEVSLVAHLLLSNPSRITGDALAISSSTIARGLATLTSREYASFQEDFPCP